MLVHGKTLFTILAFCAVVVLTLCIMALMYDSKGIFWANVELIVFNHLWLYLAVMSASTGLLMGTLTIIITVRNEDWNSFDLIDILEELFGKTLGVVISFILASLTIILLLSAGDMAQILYQAVINDLTEWRQ